MQPLTTSATIRLLVGLTTHLQAASAPERIAAFLSPTVYVGRPCLYNTRKGKGRGRLAAVVNARHQTKLQGDKNMRATKPLPTRSQKPNLKPIPGALSLYRKGDVITYTLDGIEFESPIDSVEIEDGRTLLWVTPSVGVPPSHVKSVQRRAS